MGTRRGRGAHATLPTAGTYLAAIIGQTGYAIYSTTLPVAVPGCGLLLLIMSFVHHGSCSACCCLQLYTHPELCDEEDEDEDEEDEEADGEEVDEEKGMVSGCGVWAGKGWKSGGPRGYGGRRDRCGKELGRTLPAALCGTMPADDASRC